VQKEISESRRDRFLMVESKREAWHEIVKRAQDTGATVLN
jgi:hypothetical protein